MIGDDVSLLDVITGNVIKQENNKITFKSFIVSNRTKN